MKKFLCTILSTVILVSNPIQQSLAAPNDENASLSEKIISSFSSSASSIITTSYFVIEILRKQSDIRYQILIPSSNFLKYVYYKLTDKFVKDEITLVKNINQAFNEIKGQETAKKMLRGQILSIFDSLKYFDSQSPNKGSNIIYITGPSGVGKTMMAERIAKIFLGDRVNQQSVSVNSSNIDPKNSTASVCAQLFGFNGDSGSFELVNSVISDFLKVHCTGIIIINEYDKFFTKSTDEAIRNILDNGKINSYYPHFFDCSKIIFIITSNEKYNCLSTKKCRNDDQDDSASPDNNDSKFADNPVINKGYGYQQADRNGSTTTVHDKSLLKRLNPVEFKLLDSEALKTISEDFIKKSISSYEKSYGINLSYDDSCINQMEEYCKSSSKEGRAVNDMSYALSSGIHQKMSQFKDSTASFYGKAFKLSYSSEKGKFGLEEIQNTSDDKKFNQNEDILENFQEPQSTCGGFLKIIVSTIVLTAPLLFLKK